MKNFFMNDYAINKNRKGIVYRFADSEVEITLKKYLAENPGKTTADFRALKALSDEIYYQQAKEEHAQEHKNFSLHSLGDVDDPGAPSPEVCLEMHEDTVEKERLAQAVEDFLESGKLTTTQRRRFLLFYKNGLTTRQIAAAEGICQKSIWECIQSCERKLKKFLGNTPSTPPKNCSR